MIDRVLIVVAVLALASLAYWWWSTRQGRVMTVTDPSSITAGDVGGPLGFHATLVQFSTPLCAKCPPTARLIEAIIHDDPRVLHVEIDASERLDLARRFDVMRTPTILVVDGNGLVVARMAGAPSESHVRDALAAVPVTGTEYSI